MTKLFALSNPQTQLLKSCLRRVRLDCHIVSTSDTGTTHLLTRLLLLLEGVLAVLRLTGRISTLLEIVIPLCLIRGTGSRFLVPLESRP